MTTESLQRAINTVPFRPFTIVMADGHQIPVRHPELIAHAPGGRVAVVMLSDSQIDWIDLLLAPRLVFDEHGQPAGSQGARP
jgi:hypothetical protein